MSVTKSAKAFVATGAMDDIILELFLANELPKSRQFSLKEIYKCTGYKYYRLRKYVNSNLFTVSRKTIDITADNQLLLSKAKEYAERLIKENVFPSKYEKGCYEYDLGKLFDDSYFTEEEKEFIDLMLNEFLSVASIVEFSCQTSVEDLFLFNLINHYSFNHVARKVYNDILQKKLHAGDNITSYFFTNSLSAFQIARILDAGEKYDCFYNKYELLKCDLDTNRNILIKNFLNTILYKFRDPRSRLVLLQKLNSKYPILLNENLS